MKTKQLSGIILAQTPKAYLCLLDKDKKEWFPRSQMRNIKIGRIDQEIIFDIPTWLYNDKYSVGDYYDLDYEVDEIIEHILGNGDFF